MSECKIIKAVKDTFEGRKENNISNNTYQHNRSVRFQGRNNCTSNSQENNNINKVESDKEDNNNIQDIYDDEITTLNENISSDNLEASFDVTVALVQSKNKTFYKNEIIKGLLDTGTLPTFIKKEALKDTPHTLKSTNVEANGRNKIMDSEKIASFKSSYLIYVLLVLLMW